MESPFAFRLPRPESASGISGRAGRGLFACICLSCLGFVAILALAAYWDRSIVWLHLFQALQYVAVIALAARESRWGYFLGISIATFWNYLILFVNGFFRSGMRALLASIDQGAIVRPDQMIAVFAFLLHLVLIGACVAAYWRLRRRTADDAGRLIAAFVGSVAYFIGIIALFQPLYLAMVPHLLHPHAIF
jgi:hypothetical protein